MSESLNSKMEFDHVIRVGSAGNVTDADIGLYFNLEWVLTDADKWEWADEFTLPTGWTLMSGYSGQDRYTGPVMHPSEFIGGGMERDILDTPGYYVALTVESNCQYTQDGCTEASGCHCEPVGWAVAHVALENVLLKYSNGNCVFLSTLVRNSSWMRGNLDNFVESACSLGHARDETGTKLSLVK